MKHPDPKNFWEEQKGNVLLGTVLFLAFLLYRLATVGWPPW
jgi:hypothetical protein